MKLYFLCNGNPVICDNRFCAFIQHYITALWPESYLNGVCNFIHTI